MEPNKSPYPTQQGFEQPPPPYFQPQQQPGAAPYPPGPGFNQPGFVPQNQGFIPGSTVIVQPVTTPVNRVVLVGGCPSCRAGLLEDSFGCCAIFLAIFFFPIGILCCLAMREKRCTNCNATF